MTTTLITPSSPGIQVTAHGLRINRLLNVDEWRELIAQTRMVKRTYLSVLSDLTAYGRQRFGDDVVNETLEQLEFELADATKAEIIALTDHDQRERYHLSSEHAYILGHLLGDDETARLHWAALSQEHHLTAFELKKSIEAGTLLRESDIRDRAGHGEGIPSVQSVRFQFEKWRRQFEDPARVLALPAREKRKILKQLTPIIELAAQLEQSLSSAR